MKWRLTLVLLGGVCLILSGILRWLRPGQADLAVTWSMLGAIITALPIFRDALLGFRSKAFANTEFYMNQFITLAVIACFVTQQYVVGGVVAIILLVGHILEDRSMLGTNEAINSLLHLVARERAAGARRRLKKKSMPNRSAKVISCGVRPGDTMPADGLVLSGFSTVNQATITGESLPVEVEAGANVFAGTSNLTGLIEVKVTKTGTENCPRPRQRDRRGSAANTRADRQANRRICALLYAADPAHCRLCPVFHAGCAARHLGDCGQHSVHFRAGGSFGDGGGAGGGFADGNSGEERAFLRGRQRYRHGRLRQNRHTDDRRTKVAAIEPHDGMTENELLALVGGRRTAFDSSDRARGRRRRRKIAN